MLLSESHQWSSSCQLKGVRSQEAIFPHCFQYVTQCLGDTKSQPKIRSIPIDWKTETKHLQEQLKETKFGSHCSNFKFWGCKQWFPRKDGHTSNMFVTCAPHVRSCFAFSWMLSVCWCATMVHGSLAGWSSEAFPILDLDENAHISYNINVTMRFFHHLWYPVFPTYIGLTSSVLILPVWCIAGVLLSRNWKDMRESLRWFSI